MLDRPDPRVCLLPFGGVGPLVPAVQLVEDREESRVLLDAVRDLTSELIHFVEHALPDHARRRNHDDKGLAAAGGGLLHNLVEVPVLNRVEFVNNDGVGVEAVQGVRIRGEGLENGGRGREIEVVPPLLEDGPELRRLLDHVDSLGEDLFRLVLFRGYAVNLRRALIVCDQHIQGDRGEEGRLAVFPAHKEHGLPVTAESGLLLQESEKSLNICLLEKLQHERGPDHALGLLAKPFGEYNRALPDLLVEIIRGIRVRLLYLPGEALVNGPDAAACDNLPALDCLPIGKDIIHFLPAPGGLVAKFISSSPACFWVFSGRRSRRLFERAVNDLIVAL